MPKPSIAVLLAAVVVCGCRSGNESGARIPPRDRPPLRPPARGLLAPEEKDALTAIMEDLRGDDYLKRVKAEEDLEKLVAKDPAGLSPCLVQLLDEPQLDVRVAVIRFFMKHGRESPEAVESLIQVINDQNMPVSLRSDAAGTLRRWTAKDFGYRAWTEPESVEEAGGKWKSWFRETRGLIAPPGAPPEPDSDEPE